jgi:hypothetical protein
LTFIKYEIPDFDECSHEGHHDCSEFADCINEKGTYRCQCRPGFIDSEEDGRTCLGKTLDFSFLFPAL